MVDATMELTDEQLELVAGGRYSDDGNLDIDMESDWGAYREQYLGLSVATVATLLLFAVLAA